MRLKTTLFVIIVHLFIGSHIVFATNNTDENDEKKKNNFTTQVWKNAHVDFGINKTNDYRWRNFSIGTGYGDAFKSEPDLSWQINLNYNWGKYTFYDTEAYDLIWQKTIMKTGSVTVPAILEYKVYRSFFTGINVYTGPVYELILNANANNDGISFDDINHSHFAWTVGGRFRFWTIFSLRVSYNYYPTGFFKNGDLNRSIFKASLGF